MTARLALRVHPGARREGLRGWLADGSLRMDVREAPERGRANEAVVELLARTLGIPEGSVRIARGAGSRHKWAEVEGMDGVELKRRIDAALGEAGDGE